MTGNRPDGFTGVGSIEMLVVVVEQRNFPHAQHRGGGAQLGLADRRQRGRTRMLRIARRMAVITAALTARRRQHRDIDAFPGVPGQYPSDAERLVVWMRQNGHQSE